MESESKNYGVPREMLHHFSPDEHTTQENKDGVKLGLNDDVIVESSRFYIVANINLHVHLGHEMTAKLQERGVVIRDYTGSDIEGPPLPEFFCMHYKLHHKPRDFRLGTQETTIDLEKLKELDRLWNLHQFQDIVQMKPLILSWRNIINSDGMGLIVLSFKTQVPLPTTIHRKFSLFYLNFPVISTVGLDYLFKTKWEGDVPTHITFGVLCERFELELNAIVRKVLAKTPSNRRTELFSLPGQSLERFRSLAFDTLVPIIVLNVRQPIVGSIEDWIEVHKKLLAKYVIKPELFEIGELSNNFIDELVNKSKLWSINNTSFSIANYHGILFVQFISSEKTPGSRVPEFSGFWMGSEAAFLYTTLIGIQSYFALRIFDDYLDEKMDFLVRGEKKMHLQRIMKEDTRAISTFKTQTKSLDVLQYVVEIIASVKEQVEEVENLDKLIDSDPHMLLLNTLSNAFGTPNWKDMVFEKLNTLQSYVQNEDYIRSTKGDNRMEKLLFVVALLETLFGLLQVYFMVNPS